MDDLIDKLCTGTKQLLHDCFQEPVQAQETVAAQKSGKQCMIIGTGRLKSALDDVGLAEILRNDVMNSEVETARILEEWYDARTAGENAAVVYGGLRLELSGKQTYEIYLRITVLYETCGQDWRIIHVHLSAPCRIQNGGSRPITSATLKAEEAIAFAEKMKTLASLDQMTDVYNHKTFLDLAGRMASNLTENQYCYIIDLDNFKKINDTYGHMEGDQVLKVLADILKEQTRTGDVVGRIGGDEFAILCLRIGSDEAACKVADRIIREFGKAMKKYGNDELFGLSVGITKLMPEESLYQNMRCADQALYEAKRTGKKRYCFYRSADE